MLKEKFINNLMSNSARSIKMYKNTAIMFLVRGLSMIITFISAPIMLNHVDRADYGVLLTLTSIISWVSLMDVGLGNGLRNKLPEYIAKGDTNSAKTIVSTCYASLACYIVFLIILFIVISPFIDWLNLLNSPTSNHTDIRNLAFVIFIAFCLQFLLGLINSILFAFQMPAYQSVFVLLSQVLSLFALIVQVKVFNVSSVFYIGAVNCIIPTLVLAISSLWLFKTKFKMISPSYKYIDFKSIGNVLSLGVKFFILQIITAFMLILITFGFKNKKIFLKNIFSLFIISYLINGALIFFYLTLKPKGMAVLNDKVYFDISPLLLIILTIVIYFILIIYRKLFSNHLTSAEIADVTINYCNKDINVRCKFDSGCNVKEPFSGSDVIIVEKKALDDINVPNEKMRIIPFESLGGDGIIYGFKANDVYINNTRVNKEIYVGICNNIFKNNILGLVPTNILKD